MRPAAIAVAVSCIFSGAAQAAVGVRVIFGLTDRPK